MDMLKIRQKQKSRKPDFVRQKYHTKASLPLHWRKPKQKQSKMRLCRKGHRPMPSTGYGSPAAVRGFDRSGLKPVRVSNLNALLQVAKGEGAVIASEVGTLKRILLAEQAIKNKIHVLNIKDLSKYVEEAKKAFEERIAKKKSEKKTKEEKKAKKPEKKQAEKKAEKAEEKPEEKAIEEKKQKDKILTQKK
jgi:large subunit ribosomal protein L32e